MATKVIPLPAETREKLGTRTTRRLRNAGKLPAIVYGHHQEPVNITVAAKPFNEALHRGAHVFELGIGGKKENALLKDVQYDHLGSTILHVDFARVDLNEKVTVTVGIELKGDAPGEKEGGILQQIMNDIEVTCVVTEIPDMIVFNVSNVKLDESVHVSDLALPPGVTTELDGHSVVAVCHAVKEIEIEEVVVADGQEVIKKGTTEAEGEAAAAAETK
jgi:large subunit ribosomal protein L25